jgi:hypothetical protein
MDDRSTGSTELAQACGTCAFWRPEAASATETGWGECRRMPPTLPAIHDDKLVHVGHWPHTDKRDWCGEWRPQEKPASTRS